MNKDQVLKEARRRYRLMREKNPLLDDVFRRFDLKLDIDAAAADLNNENKRSYTVKNKVKTE